MQLVAVAVDSSTVGFADYSALVVGVMKHDVGGIVVAADVTVAFAVAFVDAVCVVEAVVVAAAAVLPFAETL